MEHYRSTLGTAAASVLGLVVAARVLHPGNFEDRPRPARPVVSQAAAAVAIDNPRIAPPFDLYLRPSALAPGDAPPAPRLAATTMAPPQPTEEAAAVDGPPKAEAPRRRKVAQRVVRAGQAPVARARTATAAPADVRSMRGDPLGARPRELDRARDG